jgi:indole-3-glycerol phosphate synthase
MSGRMATGTMLDRIIDRTTAELAERRRARPFDELRRIAAAQPDPVDFVGALAKPGVGVVAEIKRGSPSRGMFPGTVEPS